MPTITPVTLMSPMLDAPGPQRGPADQDLQPLAWVRDDVHRCLDAALASLREALGPSPAAPRSGLLEAAAHNLHQVAGALEMAGLQGVARVVVAAEAVLARLAQPDSVPPPGPQASAAIERACFAVADFLDSALRGHALDPVTLFPQYAALRALVGDARTHPVALWDSPAPGLQDALQALRSAPPAQSTHPTQPPHRAEVDGAPGAVRPPSARLPALMADPALRAQLDAQVLRLVKASDPHAARELAALAAALARGLDSAPDSRLWWLASGFFEALALFPLRIDAVAKRSASRLLVVYVQQAAGQPVDADALQLELIYTCASVGPVDASQAPWLAAVRSAYGLSDAPGLDHQSAPLGRFDPSLVAAARKRLAAARDAWSALAGGDARQLRATADQFAQVADVITRLHPPLQPLAEALGAVAEHTTAVAQTPSAPLAMEVATVILFLEAVCQTLDPADTALGPRAARLAERLGRVQRGAAPEPLEPWIESLYRQASDQQVMGSVVDELRASLAEVEKALDAFFRQRGDRGPLQAVPGRLSQMRGVLSVLGLDQASRAVLRMRDQVQTLWAEPEGPQASGLIELLGLNLGALGFLVDMLHYQPALARELFVFDDARGELTPVMGRARAPTEAEAGPQRRIDRDSTSGPVGHTPESAATPGSAGGTDSTHTTHTTHSADTTGPAGISDSDDELRAIFLEEAQAVIASGVDAVRHLRQTPADLPTLTTLRRCFHTLKGSARMVGFADFGEAAWALEQLLNTWLAQARVADDSLLVLSGQALEGLAAWAEDLARGRAPTWRATQFVAPAQALRLRGELVPLASSFDSDLKAPIGLPLAPPPHASGVLSIGAHGTDASAPDAFAAPDPVPAPEEFRDIGPLRIAVGLFNVFLQEADEDSLQLQEGLATWAQEPTRPLSPELEALAHSLAGSAATVGLAGLSEMARRLEAALQGQPSAEAAPLLAAVAEHLRQLLHQFAAGLLREPDAALLQQLADWVRDHQAPLPPAEAVPTGMAPALEDAPSPVDPLVFALFEEEATELLSQLDQAWRDWLEAPGGDPVARDTLLRVLHTLKGGARVAGLWALGDAIHAAEARVEALSLQEGPALDDAADQISLEVDQLQAQFESLRQQLSPASAVRWEPAAVASPPVLAPAHAQPGVAAPGAGDAAPAPGQAGGVVRVRAQLLDGLMNQAGEVMIAGARIEAELRALREGVQELSASVERLRSQLRSVEIESESQLQSQRPQGPGGAGFDPLEFDRYTRLQELTRIMAESVNDIATVQRQLVRALDATEDDLSAQSRQTRELQRDLLRTRMLEFDSIAERLHRAVRLASRDSGKPARLEIDGGQLEIDRGMLDRIAPALEHLIRNAVAHGIEPAQVRAQRAKPATGLLRIAIEQAGNDVALQLSDDGGGLDLDRIEAQARAQGLLLPGQAPSPQMAAGLIFRPGFSTAAQVTELAGRGVGLDAVRAEIQALGGRIEVESESGQGSRFKLVLPLTTAVTHVVMMRCGAMAFGVPASLVESVVRGQAQALAQAQTEGIWPVEGPVPQALPFFWGGALLRISRRSESTDERTAAVVLLQSAAQRLALQVDEVLGHREVVVKHLGVQLSRLPGLAGMTVLASGEVVLIYNPVALAAVYGERARRFAAADDSPSAAPAAPHDPHVAVGDATDPDAVAGVPRVPAPGRPPADPPTAPAPAPAPAIPLVLVVDDSITVRRVTQRLLQREGYRVALAADGLQALERLAQETPALVLSDIEMPRMDGFELARHLRGDPRWSRLPLVVITSRVATKHREHAQVLGVDHYLGKPYAEDELLALVRRYTVPSAQALADPQS